VTPTVPTAVGELLTTDENDVVAIERGRDHRVTSASDTERDASDCRKRTTMQEPELSQSWWRRPRVRLSLRALITIVLLLGCGFGWVVRRAHVQRDAFAAIVRGGEDVWYDWELPRTRVKADGECMGGTWMRTRASPWRKWLFDRLGPDYFAKVRDVRVGANDPDQRSGRIAMGDFRST
jgi:hypothetical protein